MAQHTLEWYFFLVKISFEVCSAMVLSSFFFKSNRETMEKNKRKNNQIKRLRAPSSTLILTLHI